MKKIFTCIAMVSVIFVFCSCDKELIKKAKETGEVDLADFINKDFDYIFIVNGSSRQISDYEKDIKNDKRNLSDEKIYFVKDNRIIKQINIKDYISEPSRRDYVSFFRNYKLKYIKRFKGDTCFKCECIREFENGFKKYWLE
ncbi:MAG: hypothetical protein P1P63_03195 [Treponemataceae bacterium]